MTSGPKATREEACRDMRESQRALELRKFFAPTRASAPPSDCVFNDSLNNDGALDAYAETVVWRLKGVHAMVSLVDRGTQYFLAGAIRSGTAEDDDQDVTTSAKWFGCSTVPTPGGLCENTLALDTTQGNFPCFIVKDLSKDRRFADLPIVAGHPRYRFYAGAPITTSRGINIGSFFLFDTRVREGLSEAERKFLHHQAGNVMRHLQTKREATERRRLALMSKGIAKFIERSSHENEMNGNAGGESGGHSSVDVNGEDEAPTHLQDQGPSALQAEKSSGSVLDQIRSTLDHAAELLRESLELTVGGVIFLDPTIGYMESSARHARLDPDFDIAAQQKEGGETEKANIPKPGHLHKDPESSQDSSARSTRSAADVQKLPKVLTCSTASRAHWDSNSTELNSQSLNFLIKSYPKGNIWYIDDEGYFSSLEQISALQESVVDNPLGKKRSLSPSTLKKQKEEAAMLSRVFYKSRQIIFLPLWDAVADRWNSGCFVWSQSATPVFTVESEIAYLSSFTNSVMVEISRLDAITSNKMKSDFISSISHEFRSPLHGILSCAEFLSHDSSLDASQLEFISTIQNCGGTLLDTINHILDYSKINSFERSGDEQGTILNELYQVTNLGLLCEDIINGMMAAKDFRRPTTDYTNLPVVTEGRPGFVRLESPPSLVEIILDIELRDWNYLVQPGALRRVVMNLFGNAQKYTKSGYIMVQLEMQQASHGVGTNSPHSGEVMSLHIRDTGKGMSSDYMERKLYHPFAQEDSFATGVGLGLSIVWSIVNQLGGKISIRSELGKGTDIEVTIPVERMPMADALDSNSPLPRSHTQPANDIHLCIPTLKSRAEGKSVCLRHINKSSPYKNVLWRCIERYCTEWFGLSVQDSSADIIITDEDDLQEYTYDQRIVLVENTITSERLRDHRRRSHMCGTISEPVGPYRLARSILALMDQTPLSESERIFRARSQDVSTQTPLGSPEERTIMNGIIMTDYGFTPPSSFSNTPFAQASSSSAKHNQGEGSQGNQSSDKGDQEAIEIIRALGLSLSSSSQTETSWRLSSLTTLKSLTIPPPKPTKHGQNKDGSIQKVTGGGLNILAVDDNAVNLQLLRRYLIKRQFDNIVSAVNGAEAVAAVHKSGVKDGFDVVFMDISMPEMDGFEATRLIRSYERDTNTQSDHRQTEVIAAKASKDRGRKEESPHLQICERRSAYIVALTGLASRRDRDKAKDCGFDDFLTKPISFGKIGELLQKLSEEKAERNNLHGKVKVSSAS